MITATKTPRRTPPTRLTFRQTCAAHVIGGLAASQGQHILHAPRPDYEKAIRGFCRTAFEIADEMDRRAAS